MGLFDRLKGTLCDSAEWGSGRHFRCSDCAEEFVLPSTLEEPTCPYCDSETLLAAETP